MVRLSVLSLGLVACASAHPPYRGIDARVFAGSGVDPTSLRCNSENRWGTTLRPDAIEGAREILSLVEPQLGPLDDVARAALEKRVRGRLFSRMVRAVLLEGDNHNLGAFRLAGRTWTDEQGRARPVIVFRSGVTPDPGSEGSCFTSLLEAGRVRHVVNLFDGDLPVADLVDAERRAAASRGATHASTSEEEGGYGPWRDLLRSRPDDAEAFARASEGVARLVREQILRPDLRGNVHIHCGGGMHRSGMIAGVVERCVNREPIDVVETHYRYHVGWRGPSRPGGLEEGNLRFIRRFDCSLLDGR